MKKILFIDGQIFQTAAWDRGMGKYSLSLMRSIFNDNKFDYEESFIIFNGKLGISPEAKAVLQTALPNAEIVFLDLDLTNPSVSHTTQNSAVAHNRAVVNEYVASKGATDKNSSFIILSLLVEPLASVFPEVGRRVLLFYDLIPLQYNDRYGGLDFFSEYLKKFEFIFEADLVWAISQTVADDLAIYTGLPEARLLNIDGAAISDALTKTKPQSFRVPKKYLLMPTGDELRKNNIKAAEGLAEYNRNHKDKMWIVATSFFSDTVKTEMLKICKEIVFSGNVSSEELAWLYDHSEAVLFIPEYEGLGMPVLEGVESDKPVVCSNISVFNEISSTAFYYANHFSPTSIAAAIDMALDKHEWARKKREYPQIRSRYAWKAVGETAVQSLQKLRKRKPRNQQHLSILCPSLLHSLVSTHWLTAIHATLSEDFAIDIFTSAPDQYNSGKRASFLTAIYQSAPIEDFGANVSAHTGLTIGSVEDSADSRQAVAYSLYLPMHLSLHSTSFEQAYCALREQGVINESRFQAERDLSTMSGVAGTEFAVSMVNSAQSSVCHTTRASVALSQVVSGDHDRTIHLEMPIYAPKIMNQKIGNFTVGVMADTDDVIIQQLIDGGIEVERFSIDTCETDYEEHSRLSQLNVFLSVVPPMNDREQYLRLKAMSYGAVSITVSGEDCCVGSTIVADMESAAAEIRSLAKSKRRFEAQSQKARDYIKSHHDPTAYVAKLKKTLLRKSVK